MFFQSKLRSPTVRTHAAVRVNVCLYHLSLNADRVVKWRNRLIYHSERGLGL